MIFSRVFPATALLAGLVATASAQVSLTYDNSGSPAVGTYDHVQDYATAGAGYTNTTGKGTNPYDISPVGTKRTAIQTDIGEVTLYDLCAELFVGPTGTSDYSVTSGLAASGWSASLQNDVSVLLRNALVSTSLGGGGFNAARIDFETGGGTTYDEVAVLGAALQMALWDLVEDTGSFDIFGNDLIFANDLGGVGDTFTTDAANLADQWLTNIDDGTWKSTTDLRLFYADATAQGDPARRIRTDCSSPCLRHRSQFLNRPSHCSA